MTPGNFDINNNIDPNDEDSNAMPEQDETREGSEYISQANDSVVITGRTPIIVLFGAGSSGKTMTLIRLAQYLRTTGYQVVPERTFRNAEDTHYERMCENFATLVSSTKAPGRNQVIDFMLVKVMDSHGRPICQILEAPGEHYFDPSNPNLNFRPYLETIAQSPNKRTWMFIVEKDWMNQSDRNNYSNKITQLQNGYVRNTDKVIFTCHQADKHPALSEGGIYNKELFFSEIFNQYPGIFTRYLNHNPITKIWRPYNFDFVVFSAGRFSPDNEGGQDYVPSRVENPATLWKAILKTVRG